MSKLSSLVKWFCIDAGQPAIATAQFIELQRQVPLLYSLLVVNAVAVAYTHYGIAPNLLTTSVPAVLFVVCAFRLTVWVGRRRLHIDASGAIAQLRRTVILSSVLASAYIAWSLSLFNYGGAYEHGHVAIFIAITVIGCIFCLMHLPQAALLVTLVVMVPYLTYCIRLNNTVFLAIALNILLVTGVMLQVLLNSYRGFTTLISSRMALALKQAETERLNDENSRLAHTDPLTGLPNRRYFFARLDMMIEASGASQSKLAVGLIDLDRFKPVNDTYGHIVGDRLLAEVGARLNALAEDKATVARLGGDEFGFLTLTDEQDAAVIGKQICARLSEPYEIDGIAISIGSSCGIAVFPKAGKTAHELFDRADYALYNSKTARLGEATVFSIEHETQIRSERAVEAALRGADLEQELQVFFQPIVEGRNNHMVAVEALARWTSSVLGPVRPDTLIGIAERTGLIHNMTLTLFRKALGHLERLPPHIKLSFNLSANDVGSTQTIFAVVATVLKSGIDPRRITFELTETAVMRNFDLAVESISLLRGLGASIALDDFGTGQSSLSYLHRLPIDKVKTDRSFVSGLSDAAGRNIVASILGLCENMKLECIVEGVEDADQLAALQSLGCRTFQGFYFARPMPIEALADWLASGNGDNRRAG